MFEDSVQLLLRLEGGYSNHPNDRGKATNFGITQNILSVWRKCPVTPQDVADLTIEEAKNLYRAIFWNPLRLDNFTNPKLATLVFDQAVNSGPHAAIVRLQYILQVDQDGTLGSKTVLAANNFNDLVMSMSYWKHTQLAYARICQHDPSQLEFLAGWINRTHQLLNYILS